MCNENVSMDLPLEVKQPINPNLEDMSRCTRNTKKKKKCFWEGVGVGYDRRHNITQLR